MGYLGECAHRVDAAATAEGWSVEEGNKGRSTETGLCSWCGRRRRRCRVVLRQSLALIGSWTRNNCCMALTLLAQATLLAASCKFTFGACSLKQQQNCTRTTQPTAHAKQLATLASEGVNTQGWLAAALFFFCSVDNSITLEKAQGCCVFCSN